jgi:hypothetical protein
MFSAWNFNPLLPGLYNFNSWDLLFFFFFGMYKRTEAITDVSVQAFDPIYNGKNNSRRKPVVTLLHIRLISYSEFRPSNLHLLLI